MKFALPALLAALALAPLTASAELRVDIGQNNGRHDVLTKDAENWIVGETGQRPRNIGTTAPATEPTGLTSATQTYGDVTFTLRVAGKGVLNPSLWKGGLDTGATLATDGVTISGGDDKSALELVITGLTPGKHTLVTYHNVLERVQTSGLFTISVDGKSAVQNLKPTIRTASDYDAGAAYVEFEAVVGKPVVISVASDSAAGRNDVILNGFALDAQNPALQALKPDPIKDDEHAPEDVVLKWQPSKSAASHDFYLGTDLQAVTSATHASPEFKGALKEAAYPTKGLDPWLTYYWRVDENNGSATTPGEVWRFRIRQLAFPGAEGYGRFARGGRDGKVMIVTNLDDYRPGQPAIPGSLREAVDAAGPRIIVFAVGGTINLRAKLVVSNPYCYIAGQTAPGDGISLAGWTSAAAWATHDVIIRYVRVRVGDQNGTNDGSGLGACDNCIVDHCSVAWSIDEAFSSRSARNITLQRSIIAEALNMSVHAGYVGTGKGHSFAASIGGQIGSFHHNLIVNCAGRNWSLAGALNQGGEFSGDMDITNNIVYNWWHRTTDGGTRKLNFVGNLYIPGPGTLAKDPPFIHLLDPDAGTHGPNDYQKYYMTGNKIEGYPQFDNDNWASCLYRSVADGGPGDAAGVAHIRFDQPFFPSYVTTQSADDAYKSVLADVGANIPHYDSVDARSVDNVKKRSFTFVGSKTGIKGIIDSQADVGGWPVMKEAVGPKDTDHDGIPDDWEIAHGLNPNDPSDAMKKSTGGYANIELYINSIKPDPEP